MNEVVEMTKKIYDSSENISSKIEKVADKMENIAVNSSKNTNSVEEIATASDHLHKLIDDLNSVLMKFKT